MAVKESLCDGASQRTQDVIEPVFRKASGFYFKMLLCKVNQINHHTECCYELEKNSIDVIEISLHKK